VPLFLMPAPKAPCPQGAFFFFPMSDRRLQLGLELVPLVFWDAETGRGSGCFIRRLRASTIRISVMSAKRAPTLPLRVENW
jgi:hypothetical protein